MSEHPHYEELTVSSSRLINELRSTKTRYGNYNFSSETGFEDDDAEKIDKFLDDVSYSEMQGFKSIDNADVSDILLVNSQQSKNLSKCDILLSNMQQQDMHSTTTAALAGACTMFCYLPEPPMPLNPLIKPLMESIKKEENEHLQALSAEYLAHLVKHCTSRIPCPNSKAS